MWAGSGLESSCMEVDGKRASCELEATGMNSDVSWKLAGGGMEVS